MKKMHTFAVALLLSLSFPALASLTYVHTHFDFTSELDADADVLVIAVPQGHQAVSLPGWYSDTSGQVARAMLVAGFDGEVQQTLELIAPAGLAYGRLLLVGLGEPSDLTRVDAELIGAELAVRINATTAERINVDTSLIDDAVRAAEIAAAMAHGVELRNYRFDRYKSAPEPRPSQHYVWYAAASARAAERHAELHALARGVFTARELTNLPGSDGHPEIFADEARRALEPLGVEVTVLGPDEVKALGMNALYGVSRGSDKRAHLLVAHWRGGEDEAPIALVGKGNTFDTGGYNLKTDAESILRMQTDKAGGAAVVGALMALAGRQAPVNVAGVVPLSINLISGTAQLPGDVVTAADGSTIEVGSTDAEGRLILADGIWYAREHLNARAIADIATLTGAKVRALGEAYAAMFTEHDDIARTLRAAGDSVGEPVWPMPLEGYDDIVRSRIADRINTSMMNRMPGAQAGAVFLQHFAGEVPWVHIDMAGQALVPADLGIHPEGATGYGVRLLSEWVELYQALTR
jgi:leucyl aminopeptidase